VLARRKAYCKEAEDASGVGLSWLYTIWLTGIWLINAANRRVDHILGTATAMHHHLPCACLCLAWRVPRPNNIARTIGAVLFADEWLHYLAIWHVEPETDALT